MSFRPYSRQSYLNRPGYAYGDAARRNLSQPMPANRPQPNMHPKWVAYTQVQPARAAWIQANAPTNDFAANMMTGVVKFGDLTDKMNAAIDRAIVRDNAPKTPQAASATFPNIRAAFDALILNGGRKPITIGDVTISIAPATGANAGALYVKVGATYCGKLVPTPTGPVFRAVRDCPADLVGKLQAIESDPRAAVKAHADKLAAKLKAHAEATAAALLAGTEPPAPLSLPCGCCGLTLTDPVSVARGIGPICAGRWGF